MSRRSSRGDNPSSSSSSSSSNSSSSSSSSSSSRKRMIELEDDGEAEAEVEAEVEEVRAPVQQRKEKQRRRRNDDDDDDDDNGDAAAAKGSNGSRAPRVTKQIFTFDPMDDEGCRKLTLISNSKDKEKDAWASEPTEVREQCLKTVTRLLLTKGAQGEPVPRSAVLAALAKIDVDYKKHASCVILSAEQNIRALFGYTVTSSHPEIKGKKDELFVVNRSTSKALQGILAELSPSDAYMGFVFIVLQILFTAPGNKMDGSRVLTEVRRIDDRFPDSSSGRPGKGDAMAVPELGDGFAGLMARMQREKYIVVAKDDGAKVASEDGAQKKVYELGPRFYTEFGLRRMAKTFYEGLGQEPDAGVIKETLKKEEDILNKIKDQKGEEEDGEAN